MFIFLKESFCKTVQHLLLSHFLLEQCYNYCLHLKDYRSQRLSVYLDLFSYSKWSLKKSDEDLSKIVDISEMFLD